MRPAFSVVFLTTLIGAGQGLMLALVLTETLGRLEMVAPAPSRFYAVGAGLALVLSALGLFASFFHLGRPERAWRSAAMWRTSWLSREVIALPLFMALAAAYGAAHLHHSRLTLVIGAHAAVASLALFYCTAMIYACVKFLQEWSSPFTVPNFFLMGCASGLTLATALCAAFAVALVLPLAAAGVLVTMLAAVTRMASLAHNRGIRPRSTLQSAIGVQAPVIRQVSQGFTGRSFNTIEFFHGRTPAGMRRLRIAFIALAFMAPLVLLPLAAYSHSATLIALVFALQYGGLVIERWFFLADSNHPQNLYYQNMA